MDANPDLILYEEEFEQIVAELERLCREANAKVVFLVDKNGQLIASSGNAGGMDTTSLASLTAGNIAATGGLAKLLGEKEFSILFHEGEKDNIHISLVGDRVILVVIFDSRTSLGLVRLRVKRTSENLIRIFEEISRKTEREKPASGSAGRRHPRRSPRSPKTTSTIFSARGTPGAMSFINYSSREINCKIVYYGPGLCGKTTNLQYIYQKTNPDIRGKMISLATETERTLFFDFLPLALGSIRGFKMRFHLYTVPGQVFYDASRKLILKGVDGVVFCADSQVERMEANSESIDNLRFNLPGAGVRSGQAAVRRPVQQARPAERRAGARDARAAQPDRRAGFRGRGADRHGGLRHAQGGRPPRAHRTQEGSGRVAGRSDLDSRGRCPLS